jgi:predicted anti-sigma-YlaC factor YlaD
MKCEEIRDLMLDAAAGVGEAGPVMDEHLRACPACASKLDEMRKTMALLDEWQVPEPSPYFDTRLQARLREEAARPRAAWLQWLRAPALALSFALMMVVAGGVSFFTTRTAKPAAVQVEPGTAVGDLEQLDQNHDLYADFDVLDDLQVDQSQPDANLNP